MTVRAGEVRSGERSAIVLAGGDGTRLYPVTRRMAGEDLPKQYCQFVEGTSLLEATYRRISLGFSRERIFTVVNRNHERFYRPLLDRRQMETMVVQPENRGTAPAILYSLLRVAATQPDAPVAIFPSDHYVSDDAEFMRHVGAAFDGVDSRPDLTVLLGVTPDSPEPEYGWLDVGQPLRAGPSQLFRVRRFWEKPSREVAHRLWKQGCLWNSAVLIGRVPALLALIMRTVPRLFACFAPLRRALGTAHEAHSAEIIYEQIETLGFSESVLQKSAQTLATLPVCGLNWVDVGAPQRLIAMLESRGVRPTWAA